jgi:hypothetical protein
VVPYRGGVLVIDDPLSLLSLGIWLFAAGMWPVGFLFGACSPCCKDDCQWLINVSRCLRFTLPDRVPAAGGDFALALNRAGSGDVEYMDSTRLQIHNVQSRIRITVRLSLSASGASRTPVGDTRTQVWRFNRISPTTPPESAYDVLGPPWHLQVDLSVTGVDTQAEAGVVSSLETDEHGQTKLVLNVSQWTATITHDEVVTLSPVGLQRWGPGISGTQSFRLTSASVAATRQSGDDYFGWSISKTTGLAIEERSLAVRLPQRFVSSKIGSTGQTADHVLLDGEGSQLVDFLSGDGTLLVPVISPASVTHVEYTLSPENVMCGLSAGLIGFGIPLGIYPEFLTATAPESFADIFPRGSKPANDPFGSFEFDEWCGPESVTLRVLRASCPQLWGTSFFYRGVDLASLVTSPADFFAGDTLLWNLENGPYQTSFVKTAPLDGWTISLGGDDDFDIYSTPQIGCPEGTESGDRPPIFGGGFGVAPVDFSSRITFSSLCTPVDSFPAPTDLFPDFQAIGSFLMKANYQVTMPVQTGIDCASSASITTEQTFTGSFDVIMYRTITFLQGGQIKVGFSGSGADLAFPGVSTNETFGCPSSFGGQASATVGMTIEVIFDVPACSDEGVLSEGDWYFIPFVFGSLFSGEETAPNPCPSDPPLPPLARGEDSLFVVAPSVLPFTGGERSVTCLTGTANIDYDSLPTVPYTTPLRLVCTNWTPSTAPAEGASLTRTCADNFGDPLPVSGSVPQFELTRTVAAQTSVFPRLLSGERAFGNPVYTGTETILQESQCRLIRLLNLAGGSSSNPLFVAAEANQCFYFRPVFGGPRLLTPGGDSEGCGSLLELIGQAGLVAVPCDDCEVSVSILSGEENASVQVVQSGDKAGLIEVIAKQPYLLAGQGVTFAVSCGSDTVTQSVRRAFAAPNAPTGLSVVRNPCSTAALSWEAPFDGGQPITYTVQFRRIDVTPWTTFSTTALTTESVTGLGRVGYQFRVLAVNSVGTSPASNIATSGFALGAPTALTRTRDPCDQAQLSWVAPTQSECVVVANYRLEYRVGISGTFLVFGTVAGTATTGTITGLDPTLQYQFRVARIADDGPDLFSNTTTDPAPAAPTNVVASLGATPGEVDLTWNAVEQLCFPNTDYLVQFRPSTTSTWSDFTRAASTDKFATVTGLTAGVTYFFRVRATNGIGNSGFSAQSNSVTIP